MDVGRAACCIREAEQREKNKEIKARLKACDPIQKVLNMHSMERALGNVDLNDHGRNVNPVISRSETGCTHNQMHECDRSAEVFCKTTLSDGECISDDEEESDFSFDEFDEAFFNEHARRRFEEIQKQVVFSNNKLIVTNSAQLTDRIRNCGEKVAIVFNPDVLSSLMEQIRDILPTDANVGFIFCKVDSTNYQNFIKSFEAYKWFASEELISPEIIYRGCLVLIDIGQQKMMCKRWKNVQCMSLSELSNILVKFFKSAEATETLLSEVESVDSKLKSEEVVGFQCSRENCARNFPHEHVAARDTSVFANEYIQMDN